MLPFVSRPRQFGFGVAVAALFIAGGCHLVFGLDELSVAAGAGGIGGGSTGVGGSGVTTGGRGGAGGVAECDQASECPGVETDCRKRACDAQICSFSDVPVTTLCVRDAMNTGLCDGVGNCVECLGAADCTQPMFPTCESGECVPLSCANGMLDGDETDVDCGGGCVPCSNGNACVGNDDCESAHCSGNTCLACGVTAICSGSRYCDESQTCVDKKGPGDVCGTSGECENGQCVQGVCCNSPCDATCERCANDGLGCRPENAFADPDMDCTSTRVCDGAGVCKIRPFEACGQSSECVTNKCFNFECTF